MKEDKKFIQKAINPEHKGVLRKKLGSKKGHTISMERLEKAGKSKNTTTRRQATLAMTLKRLHKGR